MRPWLRLLPLVLLLLGSAACGGRLPQPAGGPGAPAPGAAVERFLQLAGEKSYVQMGWVFGTEKGPAATLYPLPELEKRMYAIAQVLRHDSFVLGPEQPVPGRIGAAVRFQVQLVQGGRTYTVPVVAVRGPDARWFVEQLDLEAITNAR